MTLRRYELTDHEWSILSRLLPNKRRGVPCAVDRRVVNGILWLFRTGSPWAEVPERYRSTYHLLQPFRPLAEGWCLGSPSCRCFRGLRWRHRHDRLELCLRSPSLVRRGEEQAPVNMSTDFREQFLCDQFAAVELDLRKVDVEHHFWLLCRAVRSRGHVETRCL